MSTKTRKGDGFTLIELLVVIVILGILAGVVVFAVQGAGDKGLANAKASDRRTIRTAQEAFCARFGQYGTEGQLLGLEDAPDGKRHKFLASPPVYNRITVTENSGGPCNGWSYSFTSPEADDGDPGGFEEIADPLHDYGDGELLLPSGKVLSWALNDTSGTAAGALQVYDPGEDRWEGVPTYPPCAIGRPFCEGYRVSNAFVLKGPRCGPNCGKVLMHLENPMFGMSSGQPAAWGLFDPATGVTVLTAGSKYEPDYGMRAEMLWGRACDGASSPTWCGKVLAAGGATYDFYNPAPDPTIRSGSQVYDPAANAWTQTQSLNRDRVGPVSSPLGDGRVLFVDGDEQENTAEIFDPVNLTWASIEGAAPAGRFDGYRSTRSAALIAGGRVLLVGAGSGPEIFNPADGTFTALAREVGCGDCTGRTWATPLPTGKVVVINERPGAPGKPPPERFHLRLFDPGRGSFGEAVFSPFGGGSTLINGPACQPRCGRIPVISRDAVGVKKRAQLYRPPS